MSVSAVIPAYNEEKTVGEIVRVLHEVPQVKEIIVVSDGSTDRTVEVARNAGAKVIALTQNTGKGAAMMAGVREAKYGVILFLDADLIGLTAAHVVDLINPVLLDEADMTVGIFERGRIATDLAQDLAPFLSGQRAIKKCILHDIDLEPARFGVEVAITRYASERGWRVKEVLLEDMSHIMKEEKLGLLRGFWARLKMYWEIAKYIRY
ncbi:glycosyltransferase family 2 protein [Calderihabitans maritimus]|uniref:Glucosyl-3-phosphoglycerate synthase n=1 Tax=Calderihabitans maritimus TaxID=1246530 RepID=A0A1Z5HYE2_9FIRM|nr:glycosyltransferase family 2 protein [Calderihabitans maritimus]GAW94310.1 family 2 glycosyl transferase [Calderihabitans maritimus]